MIMQDYRRNVYAIVYQLFLKDYNLLPGNSGDIKGPITWLIEWAKIILTSKAFGKASRPTMVIWKSFQAVFIFSQSYHIHF